MELKAGEKYQFDGDVEGWTYSHMTLRRVYNIGRLQIISPLNKVKRPLFNFKGIFSITQSP